MLLLNYRPVLRQPTGIGVYAHGVLPALQGLEHSLLPGGGEGGAKERLRRLAWSQARLLERARQAGASLIFTPAPEGYLGRQTIPQVVMVHDLRPISHPERSLQSLYFRAWVPPLLRSCQRVITNSQFTASEIERHTGLAASRISVIPLGYDDQLFRPASPGSSRHAAPVLAGAGLDRDQVPWDRDRKPGQRFSWKPHLFSAWATTTVDPPAGSTNSSTVCAMAWKAR